MSELQSLIEDIEKLRTNLEQLIDKKQANLQDSDIIVASQILNSAITTYNKFIFKKIKQLEA